MDFRRWTWMLGLTAAIGCGPSAAGDTTSTTEGATTGGADDGGTADDGGSSVTDPSAGSSGDATAGDTGTIDACAPAYDEEGGHPITVSIVNTQAEPIFVGYPASCLPVPFQVVDATGAQIQWHGRDCQYSCEDVLVDGCFVCGPCPGNGAIRIDPGATFVREWDGGVYDMTQFPAGCIEMPCDQNCQRRAVAEEGEFMITSIAATVCDGDAFACECQNGEPTCEVFPPGDLMTTLEVSGVVVTPGDTAITLEF